MKKGLLAAVFALVMALCTAAMAEERLSVVCTDFPCYDFARQVAGDLADVSLLIKPGVEVHAFDPTPADIVAIGGADLFIYIGGESDVWADSILAGFGGGSGPKALRLMACVKDLIAEDEHEGETPEYDEHIWTSPRNAMTMVKAVAAEMAALDSENATAYAENAENYIQEIGAVDAELSDIVTHAARRELVFADRFPFIYFTREYGLDYLAAFPSCTADTEPSAQTVMALIQKVITDRLPAIYTIELSTQAIARTIAEETGAEILTLQSLQTVSQADFDAGATYVSIMRENAEALRRGLN